MAIREVGEFKLAELTERLKGFASPAFRRDMAAALGAESLKLVDDGFRQGRDPYGVPWASPKLRSGRPLQDTGRARGSYSFRARPDGFTVGTNAHYMRTHQAPPFDIKPVRAKALRFRGRGAPTKSNPRGALGPYMFRKRVRTVQRITVPEPGFGGLGLWEQPLAAEADAVLREKAEK